MKIVEKIVIDFIRTIVTEFEITYYITKNLKRFFDS